MLRLVTLRILESYFQHRWLYFLPLVLMIGLGAYYAFDAKPTYTAKGVLYVETQSYLASLTNVSGTGSDPAWWKTPAQVTNEEIGELLQTDAFVRAIIRQTDLETEMDKGTDTVNTVIKETRRGIWSAPLGNNQLQVSAVHENPFIAYQLVNAVIERYLQWRINTNLAESEAARAFFIDLIDTYEANLAAARSEMRRYLEAHPAPIRGERPGDEALEIDRLQAAIDLATTRYVAALDKEENTRLAMAQIESDARQTYFLIDAPLIPEESNTSLRQLALQAGIFVLAGVLLSGGLIVGAAIIDRSFRFPVDVVHRLDLPVLSMVPDTTPPRKQLSFRRKTAVRAGNQLITPDDKMTDLASENTHEENKLKLDQGDKVHFTI